jgi:hypothetical protein
MKVKAGRLVTGFWPLASGHRQLKRWKAGGITLTEKANNIISRQNVVYTAFHKNIPAGISGCRKKRLNNGTFF